MVSESQLTEVLESVSPVIIRRYQSRLSRSIGRRFDVHDLVQVTCMRAHVARGSCRATNEEELRHWVLSIAQNNYRKALEHHNCAMRSIKREERPTSLEDSGEDSNPYQADTAESPADSMDCREQFAVIAAVLERIPARQATAVRLRFVAEADYELIANKMGITVNSARLLVSRGLKAIRERLT